MNEDGGSAAMPSSNLGTWTRRLRHAPSTVLAAVDAIDAEAQDSAVRFAAERVRRYIASDGRDDGGEGPRPTVVLYTRGRRSGRHRRNPLLFLAHEGRRACYHATHPDRGAGAGDGRTILAARRR